MTLYKLIRIVKDKLFACQIILIFYNYDEHVESWHQPKKYEGCKPPLMTFT